MSNYNLNGLESRTFQQMVQALVIRELGAGISVYGDGPDGGRDASFNGKVNYQTHGIDCRSGGVTSSQFTIDEFLCDKVGGNVKSEDATP